MDQLEQEDWDYNDQRPMPGLQLRCPELDFTLAYTIWMGIILTYL